MKRSTKKQARRILRDVIRLIRRLSEESKYEAPKLIAEMQKAAGFRVTGK